MNKALLVAAAIAVFALLSAAAMAAEKPVGHLDGAMVAQGSSSSGSSGMQTPGTTGTQPSKSHKMKSTRTHKATKSTAAKAGAGPSKRMAKHHKAYYGAGPRRMAKHHRRTHRMPRAGMDFGLLSMGGAALAFAGFALRRRSR